ncbi:MAG: hypothetical protein JJU32_19755 [Phormidium sp. BM_Day4_Bin.17]|nr:hypothetical protein [Phormidium sp. BM_Day4_Bin.17]UCJ10683.1 MAG: hypothetical protein JWS08_12635 [Phormidium sp. PBR-2020]
MGLFQNGLGWVGGLIDSLLNWLGRALEAFIKALVSLLQILWEISILAILLPAFGALSILHVIFYSGVAAGVIFAEFWDPNHMNPKPEVFKISEASKDIPLLKKREYSQFKKIVLAPKDSPLPKKREDAQVHQILV